jgi:hypothetical protein
MLVRIQSPEGTRTRECDGYDVKEHESTRLNDPDYVILELTKGKDTSIGVYHVPKIEGWAIYVMNAEGLTIDSYRWPERKEKK